MKSIESVTNTFNISPIIRITLLSLYIALTVPLPFLAKATSAPISPYLLWMGIMIGFIAVYAALSQKVVTNESSIGVTYPSWVPSLFYKGWKLDWNKIDALKSRTTGQGGLVYYFVTPEKDRAYLLPMRIAGFAKMVRIVSQKTAIDTTDIKPLAQPWMYLILFIFTMILWLIDGWTIWTAISLKS